MGCDIHAAIEYKDEKGWHALMHDNKRFGKFGDEDKQTARLNLNRDYDLFAVLANVRNGRGFAGCLTSTAFDSISDQRGLPEDITTEAQESCWGDHSDTWVSLAGILAFDWTRSTTHYGVVSAREFEQWDRMKEWEPAPRSYCGDVTGGQTKKISPTKMRSHIKETVGELRGAAYQEALEKLDPNLYTQISWEETYTYSTRQMWEKILPPMLKLGSQYGPDNVRLVMNFDS